MTAGRVAIVGAGVSGLAAAYTLRSRSPQTEVLVLERSTRVGGLVETERTADGFIIEHGPDSLVTHHPAAVEAACRLGLKKRFVTGAPAPRRAFIARGAELVPLPPAMLAMTARTAFALLGSPLLSPSAKARFLAEPLMPRRRVGGDESVAEFFDRRFGREVTRKLIEPLLCGIYATPTSELSMHAAMPQLAAMEQNAGSVALGVMLARARRRTNLPGAVSFRSGMAELTEALAQTLPGRIHVRTEIRSVERAASGRLRLCIADGGSLDVDGLIIAAPAWTAAHILASLDRELGAMLGEIEYTPLVSMSLAWPRRRIPRALDGTGFLVAPEERRFITACTWSSEKWPARAPAGWALLRVFAADTGATEAELVDRSRADLRELMGIRDPPALVRIRRSPRLMSKRRVGHLELTGRIQRHAAEIGSIALAGNAVGTIGIPACIASGIEAAQRVCATS
jgi:oxygen-dependent protoporphyrinogen oxidase